jgi:hypothetical protein
MSKRERAQFASEVKELYGLAMAGKPPEKEYKREVRQAAYGLVALRQSSDYWFKKFEQDPDLTRLASSGVSEAKAIVDALTTGLDHPIWRHIEGLQTTEHRPNRARKAAAEEMRQSIAGGLVLALGDAVGSERKAADTIVAGISSPDFSFTASQLRKWAKHAQAMECAQQIAAEARHVDSSKTTAERLLIAGRTLIFKYWSTPM